MSRRGRVLFDRFRLANGLRALSALCLALLAGTLFWQPIQRAVRPHVAPTLQHVAVPEALRPKAKEFLVRIVSEPSGATVTIDGDARGTTPLFANVHCGQDAEIQITVEKSGFAAWRQTAQCQDDGELTIRARLKRSAQAR